MKVHENLWMDVWLYLKVKNQSRNNKLKYIWRGEWSREQTLLAGKGEIGGALRSWALRCDYAETRQLEAGLIYGLVVNQGVAI